MEHTNKLVPEKLVFFTFFLAISIQLQSCIPLNKVHKIEHFEIREGKPNARKERKIYTNFMISNQFSPARALMFLETKYKVYLHRNIAYVTEQLFLDVPVTFEIEFEFSDGRHKYINLVTLIADSMIDNHNTNNVHDKNDYIVQEGKQMNFISIRVKDAAGKDYLAKDSELRDRLILYFKSLTNEYKKYRKPINSDLGKAK